MNDYRQPDFYRFNQDSLALVRWVLTKEKNVSSILDLGAGSGVIGIELANAITPQKLTLLEGEMEFGPYLEANIREQLKVETKTQYVLQTFSKWISESQDRYDLIVSNPPYYLPSHGKESHDHRRRAARSFVIDGWEVFFECIDKALNQSGRAYFVIKKDHVLEAKINPLMSQFQIEQYSEDNLIFYRLARLNKN